MKNLIWLVAIFAVVAIFPSCEKEPIKDEQPADLVAPEIPPMAMFLMPTGDFDQSNVDTSGAPGFGTGGGGNGSYHNWFHSAVHLVVWHTIVSVNMAVPTAAFAHAVNQTPVYIGDLTFEWDYNYVAPANLGGHIYYVRLTGQVTPDYEQVNWILTLTQDGGFQDFVWYTGITATDHTEGEFILNHQPNNPQEFVRMNYEKDAVTADAKLRFTNIIPNNPNFGEYIEYRETPANALNRSFEVQADPDNFLEIQWSDPNTGGRVRHPIHFGDALWHCWDDTFQDVDCD